jgi:ribosome-associated protein
MLDCLMGEIRFRTSRSSGPGGQHVNKTESRVELLWNLKQSLCLNEQQKALIASRLGNRLSDDGFLLLASEKHRSQYRNREEVSERFRTLVKSALVPVKKRRRTKPTRASIEDRIKQKKIRGEIKKSRRHPPGE